MGGGAISNWIFVYMIGWPFHYTLLRFTTPEQLSTMGSSSPHMQSENDHNQDSDNRQDSDSVRAVTFNIHHQAVYINSFNTQNFKMQNCGNGNKCWSSSTSRSSIASDEARPFIRSSGTPTSSSVAKCYPHAGSIGPRPQALYFSLILFYPLRHSSPYKVLGEAYQL